MAAAADLSIVIPNWNGRDLLAACLDSVRATRRGLDLEVIVVDNASTDGSADLLRGRFPEVRIAANERNEGFARACNQGVAAGSAPLVVLLNSDTILQPGSLQSLLDFARARPEAAVVGVQLRNADGSFQSSHSPFPTLWIELMIHTGLGRLFNGSAYPWRGPGIEEGPQRVDWVGGACMLVRRQAYEALAGLDEGYFMYAEEMDLCYRARQAGFEVWYEPASVVVHLGRGSVAHLGARGEAMLLRGRLRFHRLHRSSGAALIVRWMIVAATAAKIGVHGVLRAVSGGRRGRHVVPLRQLLAEIRGA